MQNMLRALRNLRSAVVRIALDRASAADRDAALARWRVQLAASAPPAGSHPDAAVGGQQRPSPPPATQAQIPLVDPDLTRPHKEHKQTLDPAFGLLLHDLGYKRVYLCSLDLLMRIPVWEKQRAYRHDRAQSIARDKIRAASVQGAHLSAARFPGVITLYERASPHGPPPAIGILDGQHRRGALKIISSKGMLDPTAPSVLVEVFSLPADRDEMRAQAKALFLEINKAQPVKSVDLPDTGANEDESFILYKVMETLETDYPQFFSQSNSPRPPNLNGDNLRDALYTSDLLSRSESKSASELLSWIMTRNNNLSKLSDKEWRKRFSGRPTGPSFGKALMKCRNYGFFLGMDAHWITDK